MEILEKNNLRHKIIAILIFILLFQFLYTYFPITIVYADEATTQNQNDSNVGETEMSESLRGKLLEPILDLVTSAGEGIEFILQRSILGIPFSSMYIDMDGENVIIAGIKKFIGAATFGVLRIYKHR